MAPVCLGIPCFLWVLIGHYAVDIAITILPVSLSSMIMSQDFRIPDFSDFNLSSPILASTVFLLDSSSTVFLFFYLLTLSCLLSALPVCVHQFAPVLVYQGGCQVVDVK